MNALRGYDTCEACRGRPEHEVDVPFAPGDDDLALDVVDQTPGGRMFRDLGTHSQEIDEYELAQDLSMNVGTRMVPGLAKVPDDLIGGGHYRRVLVTARRRRPARYAALGSRASESRKTNSTSA